MAQQNLDLGQHFMKDDLLLDLVIKSADIKTNETILEVGSGEGALSKKILEKNPIELICVEIDERYKLRDEKISFIQGNILNEIGILFFDNFVANIPYHISEPLMIKLLQKRVKKATIVCGKKFAYLMLGESILGLISRTYYDINLIEEISPTAFNPPPKVDSALITLRAKNTTEIFLTFYEHQKSRVKNYLIKLAEGKITKKELKSLLSEVADIADLSLYMLTYDEYQQLYTFINKYLL